jgi:hypothetical protein
MQEEELKEKSQDGDFFKKLQFQSFYMQSRDSNKSFGVGDCSS